MKNILSFKVPTIKCQSLICSRGYCFAIKSYNNERICSLERIIFVIDLKTHEYINNSKTISWELM